MNLSLRIGKALFLAAAFLFAFSAVTRADDAASLYKTKCAVCHAPDGSGSSTMGKKCGRMKSRRNRTRI